MQKSQPGCFSPFGCFGLCVILAALAFIVIGWRHGDPSLLPRFSLPSLLSHSLAQAGRVSSPSPSHESYTLSGKPTISAAFINRVLAFYHSPAAGLGQALYDDGLTSGIDPVFALAFFQHESTFGRYGMAPLTRSLGNLRCLPHYPCLQGYAAFLSWQEGFRVWYFLIRDLYVGQWHKVTVAQIIPTYAPASDGNNIAAYIAAVKHDVDTWREGRVAV